MTASCSFGELVTQPTCVGGGGVWASSHKSGSHNVVVGRGNNYSRYAGLVVGNDNTVSGTYASVSGGELNTASGTHSSVSGGRQNTASGAFSAVSAGRLNTASGPNDWVAGALFQDQ